MGKFTADPEIIRAEGNKIMDQSQLFRQNTKKVFDTVNEMTSSDYLAPEARAIAEEIRSYSGMLNEMAQVIEDYAVFCGNTSASVVNNQDNIISGIRGGANRGY